MLSILQLYHERCLGADQENTNMFGLRLGPILSAGNIMSWQLCSYFLSSATLRAEYGNTLRRPLPVQPISFPVIFPVRGPVLVPAAKLTPLPINPDIITRYSPPGWRGSWSGHDPRSVAARSGYSLPWVLTAEMTFIGHRRASIFLFF